MWGGGGGGGLKLDMILHMLHMHKSITLHSFKLSKIELVMVLEITASFKLEGGCAPPVSSPPAPPPPISKPL